MVSATDIVGFLSVCLHTERYPPDQEGGVYRSSDRMVGRLGLALEPFSELADWVDRQRLDALWLHRPWKADLRKLPADLLILTHHLPFDETLTTGYNLRLAALLDLTDIEPLGYKNSPAPDGELLAPRPIGLIGNAPRRSLDEWRRMLDALIDGYDSLHEGTAAQPERVAIVGAMTDALVREAAQRGADLYLTGQFRQPGRRAMQETGLSVMALGHHRTEVWGLQKLAALLRERWPHLEVISRS